MRHWFSAESKELPLRFHLEPYAGNPWALSFDPPRNIPPGLANGVRGRLIEFDEIRNGHWKGYRYLDEEAPNTRFFDAELNDNWVQITTTNAADTSAFRRQKLAEFAEVLNKATGGFNSGVFDLRVPETFSQSTINNLRQDLINHLDLLESQGRISLATQLKISISVTVYNSKWTN